MIFGKQLERELRRKRALRNLSLCCVVATVRSRGTISKNERFHPRAAVMISFRSGFTVDAFAAEGGL